MPFTKPQTTPAQSIPARPPAGPRPIDPSEFKHVAGGAPRGGWAAASSAELMAPRGGWAAA